MPGIESRPALRRYHALDSLRATMMLLGLVLHTSVNYLPLIPDSANWPYQDERTSVAFGWLIAFIHIFRMPVFFMVAGFFAAYLFQTRGAKAFLRHRLSRIGLPLLCSWPVLYAVLVGSAPYAQIFTAAPPPHQEIAPGLSLLHLWFLYHLLLFCFCAVFVAPLVDRLPSKWREQFLDVFERMVPGASGIVVLSVVSSAMLMPMKTWHFDSATSMLPPPHVLGGYGLLFAFGWFVFMRRQMLEGFKSRAWTHFGAGFFFHGVYLFLFDQGYPNPMTPDKALLTSPMYAIFHDADLTAEAATATHVLAIASLALSVWFLTYGFFGLFLRYLGRPSNSWRYVADASYWMYIVHLPFAVWLPVLLADRPFPAGVKFGLALLGVAAICLVSYHYLVRSTFIGRGLNGRRYPRVAPWRATPEGLIEGPPSAGQQQW